MELKNSSEFDSHLQTPGVPLRPSQTETDVDINDKVSHKEVDRTALRYRHMEFKEASDFEDRQTPVPSRKSTENKILVTDAVEELSPISPTDRLKRFAVVKSALKTVNGVRQFMEYPFSGEPEKQAEDTLAALEPFFWLLRFLGLCSRAAIFSAAETPSTEKMRKKWNMALMAYSVTMGIFLGLGFIATFGFSMMWPVAFCAGFQSIMQNNQSYCRIDVMERFLTPKGMSTIVQSAFLFIGVSNMVTSFIASRKLGPMVKLLREYYAITRATIVQSHKKIAIIHAVLTVVVAAAIGIPFTVAYENMLEEMKTENSYEGYPFADIDTPLVKIENWIAFTKYNATISKADKFVLNSLKIVFRVENFFMFLSCFAVPFFFSLMCDVMGKEWKRFLAYLKLDKTRSSLSVQEIRNIRNSHWILCKMSYFLDGCFSKMILIIYVLFIVVNSSIIYIVLKFGAISSGPDRFTFYQAIIMFIALEIIFFLVIRQAMKVHSIASEVIVAVRDWQPDLDESMASEYLLLINQTSSAEVSFTAGNCFRIEETAYINALAIIFSYVLMLLQFQPSSGNM